MSTGLVLIRLALGSMLITHRMNKIPGPGHHTFTKREAAQRPEYGRSNVRFLLRPR